MSGHQCDSIGLLSNIESILSNIGYTKVGDDYKKTSIESSGSTMIINGRPVDNKVEVNIIINIEGPNTIDDNEFYIIYIKKMSSGFTQLNIGESVYNDMDLYKIIKEYSL